MRSKIRLNYAFLLFSRAQTRES